MIGILLLLLVLLGYVSIMDSATSTPVGNIIPSVAAAIKMAEGNPRNFGVLSEKTSGPSEANTILNNSIRNNYRRWIAAGQPGTFIQFMGNRWAPIGASNDPNNLNKNWVPNVKSILQRQLGDEEYNKWKMLNLVQLFQSADTAKG
jgi:hypothetical protein